MFIALTRGVPPSIDRCELTHVSREPIDFARAIEQHGAYERALVRLGCRVEHLPELPDLPDSVFVEDAAVVFDEVAVIARPGAESRRAEVPSVVDALSAYRDVRFIDGPATLDGGDVLVDRRRVYIGASARTNADAARQLAALLSRFGYTVIAIPVRGCLHLKSAVTLAAPETLVLNPDLVEPAAFDGVQLIHVDPSEPMAANVLQVGDMTLCATAYPRTRARLEAHGIRVEALDATEVAKAEGALTCCSIILRA
ncbi:MAG: dimethylargininase [Acidobacteria bacterium]|nr:MAG: dimethylargininase [Acidobacteriota bacterium]